MTKLRVDDLPVADPARYRVAAPDGSTPDGFEEGRFGELLDALDPDDVEHGWIGITRHEPIAGLERLTVWNLEITGRGNLLVEHRVLEAEVIEDDDPYDEEEVTLVCAQLRGQDRQTVLDAMRMVARGGGPQLLEALPWTRD